CRSAACLVNFDHTHGATSRRPQYRQLPLECSSGCEARCARIEACQILLEAVRLKAGSHTPCLSSIWPQSPPFSIHCRELSILPLRWILLSIIKLMLKSTIACRFCVLNNTEY